MCLIINRERGQIITDDFIRDVEKRNDDGWGFMYNRPSDGRVIVKKGLKLEEFFAAFHPVQEKDIPCVIHFRMRTHGAVDVENCHPFEVARGLYFMHNGTINIDIPKKDAQSLSDTNVFVRDVLRPLVLSLKDRTSGLRSKWFDHFMDAQASAHRSRFALMDEEGPLYWGDWTKTTTGVWCSNTYAYSLNNPTKPAVTHTYTPSNRSLTAYGYYDDYYGDNDPYAKYNQREGETLDDYYKRIGVIKGNTGSNSRAQDSAKRVNSVYTTSYMKGDNETIVEYYKRLGITKDSHRYKLAGETETDFKDRMQGKYQALIKLPNVLDPDILRKISLEEGSTTSDVALFVRKDQEYAEMYLKLAEEKAKEVGTSAVPFQQATQATSNAGTQKSSTTQAADSQKTSGESNTNGLTNSQNDKSKSSSESQEDESMSAWADEVEGRDVGTFIDLVDAINAPADDSEKAIQLFLEEELEKELEQFEEVAEEDWALTNEVIEQCVDKIVNGELHFNYKTDGTSTLCTPDGVVVYPDFLVSSVKAAK